MKNKTVIVAIMAFLVLFFTACNPESPTQYHKVNYIGTDGNIMETHDVESGKTDTPPESPTREGHEFIGWSLIKDSKETFDFKNPVTSEITLYPVWKINSYKVTFVYGEDVVYSLSEISVDYGSTIPPQNISKTGHALKGWSTKEDGSEPYDLVTGPVTLYPIWGKTCTVTFVCDEDVTNTPKPVTVFVDTIIEAPEQPSKYGYAFKGWKTSLDADDFFSFGAINSDITLYPHFEGKEMNVFINYQDGEPLASKIYRTGDLLTPSSLGIGLDDSIFTWELVDDSTKVSYDLNKPLPYIESGYTFVAHISSSLLTVDEAGAISGSEDLKAKEGSYTLFIPRYLKGKRVTAINENGFLSDNSYKGKTYQFDKVILPNTLTIIGNNAFAFCNVEEILIPSSVEEIKDNAFSYCSLLKELDLPSSLKIIGSHAFQCCKTITEVNIPSSVETIGQGAFVNCQNLKSVTFPKNINVIPKECFSGCTNLESITFNGEITKIGDSAFYFCKKLKLDIPSSVKTIEAGAFWWCSSFTKIEIPYGVESIGMQAFNWCESLKEVIIPSSVTSIGASAFNRSPSDIVVKINQTKNESMDNYPWGINNTENIKWKGEF